MRDITVTCLGETPDHCAIPSEYQDLADSAFNGPVSKGLHYVSILDVGEDALLARIHLIRAARESIDIQTFIWDNDQVGRMLFEELLQAARRGVKVRLLLDHLGTYVSVEDIAKMAVVHSNIDIKFFRPMKKGGWFSSNEIQALITDSKSLNKRMHNKVFIVDGRIGIVGGRNIQNAYYDYDSGLCFKDLDLLVVGPEVRDMAVSFNEYWDHDLSQTALMLPDVADQAIQLEQANVFTVFVEMDLSVLRPLRDMADSYSLVQHCPSVALHRVNHVEYVADRPEKMNLLESRDRWNSTRRVEDLVTSAQYEIVMQTPYLIQDRRGVRDFKSLRKKRPDIKIALSTNSLASTDMFYVYAMCFKQRQFYLETAGAYLYEFKPRPADVEAIVPRYLQLVHELNDITPDSMLEPIHSKKIKLPRLIVHSKFFVVDDHVSFVGSHNFDPRAKNLNTESALIVWDDELAQQLQMIFERDTSPQNSWVVARREKIPLVGNASDLIAAISSSLPLFDIWPFEYSSNFELKEGFEPLPPTHVDFYEHYNDVGIFPEKGLSYEDLGTRFVRAFGGFLIDIM
jgi:phosphatidylserine/phosphatidylglycerophosphate/cardiolipin synthase-like enzyme